jgi:hypothetical protein
MDEEWPRAEFHAETILVRADADWTYVHLTLVGSARVLPVILPFSALAALRDQVDALLAERH